MPVVGYTTGVFDLFHIGHLNLLNRAKAECDELIVGVTTDELCLTRKGVTPIIAFEERIAIVDALSVVDAAVPQASMDKSAAWEMHRFDRMFVGDDWKGTPEWNQFELDFREVGVEIIYFSYTATTSSSVLRQAIARVNAGGARA